VPGVAFQPEIDPDSLQPRLQRFGRDEVDIGLSEIADEKILKVHIGRFTPPARAWHRKNVQTSTILC